MKRENWNTLGNIFEVKTRKSFKKAFVFSERHYTALHGQNSDAYVANVFNGFVTPYDNFHQAYARWNSHTALLGGAVQDLNETLLTINPKLKEWEGKIFSNYPEGSEEATSLFPRKRTPFYKGNYTVRTQAVMVLAKSLEQYPLLATVKTDVDAFHTLLYGKLQHKIGLDGLVGKFSKELEQQRKAITTAMYGNLGLLMFHYRDRAQMLKVFFDMGVLKNKVKRKGKKKAKLK
jgi:hypothetical protein